MAGAPSDPAATTTGRSTYPVVEGALTSHAETSPWVVSAHSRRSQPSCLMAWCRHLEASAADASATLDQPYRRYRSIPHHLLRPVLAPPTHGGVLSPVPSRRRPGVRYRRSRGQSGSHLPPDRRPYHRRRAAARLCCFVA